MLHLQLQQEPKHEEAATKYRLHYKEPMMDLQSYFDRLQVGLKAFDRLFAVNPEEFLT